MKLNKSQKEAVEHIDGPMLIIAGPGSGKTRTLVERVVNMVKNKGISPDKILISTFTERAARELITRITSRLKDENIYMNSLYIGTIHSICLRIIDENIEYSLLKKGYKVLETIDQKFFIFSKLKYFKEILGYNEFFIKKSYMNSWKQGEILLKWFNKLSEEGIEETILKENINLKISFLGEAFEKYKKMLLQENKLDFSMIQLEAFRILKENSIALENIQNKINYIMIDEYQDTNTIQEKLIFLIGNKFKNICVVGDDDQGIYRFRGATIKNILQFESKFQNECKVVKLETNYRSEKSIVSFCKAWIDSLYWDGFRHEKNLIVPEEKDSDEAKAVRLSVSESENTWQERIGEFLKFLKNTGKIKDYNQVAFLFRSVKNKKIVSLAHYLEYKGIGVYSPRSNLFFYRDEIKEIIGIFLYVLIREDNKVFKTEYKLDIVDYYKNCLNILEKKIRKDLDYFNQLEKLKIEYENLKDGKNGLLELFYEVLALKGMESFIKNDSEGVLENRKLYNIGIFSKIVEKADILSRSSKITEENIIKITDYFFLMHLKFLKQNGVDEYEDIKEFAPKGAVSFLTIHQSKGLEFPVVIVGSLESSPEKERDKDEEIEEIFLKNDSFEPEYRIKEFDFWRLYYTAFSRAKDLLVLSCVEISKGKREVPSPAFKRVYEMLPDIISKEVNLDKLNISETNDVQLMDAFSCTSHYLKYVNCPFKYKMNKIFEFKGLRTPSTFFGNLVHQSLEFINKEYLNGEKISLEDVEKNYLNDYENLKISQGIKLPEKIVEAGLEQVKRYLKDGFEFYKNISYVEKELHILKEDYTIEGKLDLVIEKEGELIVVDFKTGDMEKSLENLEDYKFQIKFYCCLLQKNTDKKVKGGVIYFVKDGSKIDVDFNNNEVEDILKKFDEIIKKIQNQKFTERTQNKKKCLNCEFKKYCFSVNMI